MKLYRLPDVNSSSCLLLVFAARCPDTVSRRPSLSWPLHPLRAPRRLACGRWSGATSPRWPSCCRSTWNVSSSPLPWENRRWRTGSCRRTTSSTHMLWRYEESVSMTRTAWQWFLCVNLLLCLQGDGGVLTDFTSFYTLPSTVMHHPLHRSLKAAYSFYNVYTQTPLLDLMNDALILAKLVRSSLDSGSLSSQDVIQSKRINQIKLTIFDESKSKSLLW